MSMNLKCNKFEMFQTPTYITYMCMMNDSGKIEFEYENKKAIAPLLRYLEYTDNFYEKKCNDRAIEKNEDQRKLWEDERKKNKKMLNDLVNNPHGLKVWIS